MEEKLGERTPDKNLIMQMANGEFQPAQLFLLEVSSSEV